MPAAAALAALTFALRIYHLAAQGVDWDEAWGIGAAHSGLANIIHITATIEPHPPFFYSFLAGWHLVAGDSEFALRFPAVAAGLLTGLLIWRLCRLAGWPGASWLAALLFAASPLQLWYGQDVRMYAYLAFFGVLLVYATMRLLATGSRGWVATYITAAILTLFTQYYGAFLFAFVNGLALLVWRLKKDRHRASPAAAGDVQVRLSPRTWLACQVAAGAPFAAWLAYALPITVDYSHSPGPQPLLRLAHDALLLHTVGPSGDQLGFGVALGFLAVALIGLAASWRDGQWKPVLRLSLLLGYACVPLALGLIVSQVRPMFEGRYLMVSAPAFFVLLALGVGGLFRLLAPLGILAGVFLLGAEGVSLHSYYTTYAKDLFPGALHYALQHVQPGDGVVLDSADQAGQFWYYMTVRGQDEVPNLTFRAAASDVPGTQHTLDTMLANQHGIWLLNWDTLYVDNNHVVEEYLSRSAFQAFKRTVGSDSYEYFVAPTHDQPRAQDLDLSCDGALHLSRLALYGSSFRPGQVLPLEATWQAQGSSRADYMMSWRLVDAQGHVIAQRDSTPEAGFAPTSGWSRGQTVVDRLGLQIPATAPAGQYNVQLVTYDGASGRACTMTGSNPPGGPIPVAALTVADEAPLPALGDEPSLQIKLALDGLRLQGFELPSQPITAGQNLAVKLYWRADRPDGYQATLRLKGTTEVVQPVALTDVLPHNSRRSVLSQTDIAIPPDFASGSYPLELELRDAQGRTATYSGFAPVKVQGVQRAFALPHIQHPLHVSFNGQAELAGYDLGQPAASQLQLALYWRDLQPLAAGYKVFVHLLDRQDRIVAQSDAVPAGGQSPTTSWLSGQVVVDRHQLDGIPTAAACPCSLEVGLYEPDSGKRLPAAGGGDSWRLGNVDLNG